jgi:hypothetical protein
MRLSSVVCTVASLLVFQSTASLLVLGVRPCDICPETSEPIGKVTPPIRFAYYYFLTAMCYPQWQRQWPNRFE